MKKIESVSVGNGTIIYDTYSNKIRADEMGRAYRHLMISMIGIADVKNMSPEQDAKLRSEVLKFVESLGV